MTLNAATQVLCLVGVRCNRIIGFFRHWVKLVYPISKTWLLICDKPGEAFTAAAGMLFVHGKRILFLVSFPAIQELAARDSGQHCQSMSWNQTNPRRPSVIHLHPSFQLYPAIGNSSGPDPRYIPASGFHHDSRCPNTGTLSRLSWMQHDLLGSFDIEWSQFNLSQNHEHLWTVTQSRGSLRNIESKPDFAIYNYSCDMSWEPFVPVIIGKTMFQVALTSKWCQINVEATLIWRRIDVGFGVIRAGLRSINVGVRSINIGLRSDQCWSVSDYGRIAAGLMLN